VNVNCPNNKDGSSDSIRTNGKFLVSIGHFELLQARQAAKSSGKFYKNLGAGIMENLHFGVSGLFSKLLRFQVSE
jgi:hypothetical protein